MSDTSTEAVQALIATVQNRYGAFDHFHRELADAAEALLDERQLATAHRAADEVKIDAQQQRIRDLEASRNDVQQEFNAALDDIADMRKRAERAEADLAAALTEQRGDATTITRLAAKLDRKRLIHVLWDQVPEDWDENDIGILVDAILTDTDETIGDADA